MLDINQKGIPAVPHLSGIGDTCQSLTTLLDSYQQAGIQKIVALRGDLPQYYEKLARFSARCGAEIPRWIEKRLLDFQDDKTSLIAFGIDVVTQLCARLLNIGVPGFHFYVLNQAAPTLRVLKQLGLKPINLVQVQK